MRKEQQLTLNFRARKLGHRGIMTGEALQISPANDPRGSPAKEQQAAGVGILLQIMMLVLSFVLGHVLRRHKFYYLPEASASLLIGLIVGALANISNTETNVSYLGGVMFVMYRLPFVECLMFGVLISATDPVTALSIFQVNAAGDLCAICQEKMHAPILLRCKHIFCEDCVSEWFERERTCPLCRALVKAADLRSFGDGSTSLFFQIF